MDVLDVMFLAESQLQNVKDRDQLCCFVAAAMTTAEEFKEIGTFAQ